MKSEDNLKSDNSLAFIDAILEDPSTPDEILFLTLKKSSTISDFLEDVLSAEIGVSEVQFSNGKELKSVNSNNFSNKFSDLAGSSDSLRIKLISDSHKQEIYKLECHTVSFANTGSDNKEVNKVLLKGADFRRATKGINLEFQCQNEKCQAFGKNVICQLGLRKFKPQKHYEECKCPVCQVPIDIEKEKINVIFYECQYKTSGKRKESNSSPPVVIDPKDWDVVNNGLFSRFTPEFSGTKKWIKLKIEAKALDS